jgi:hypothetical protein
MITAKAKLLGRQGKALDIPSEMADGVGGR